MEEGELSMDEGEDLKTDGDGAPSIKQCWWNIHSSNMLELLR